MLVGSGTAEADLRARLEGRAHTGSVHFEGFVSEEEKVRWLQRAEVLVQPSHKEGWGLTVLEANACGTPVVATRVPGLQDSVQHGETGLLVEGGDHEALAQAIGRILADPSLRDHLVQGALEWADRFSWDAVADAFAVVLSAAARRETLPEVPDFLAPSDRV